MHVERTKKGVGEWNSQEEYNLAGIPRQNPKILEVQCAATQLQYRFTINNDIDSHRQPHCDSRDFQIDIQCRHNIQYTPCNIMHIQPIKTYRYKKRTYKTCHEIGYFLKIVINFVHIIEIRIAVHFRKIHFQTLFGCNPLFRIP